MGSRRSKKSASTASPASRQTTLTLLVLGALATCVAITLWWQRLPPSPKPTQQRSLDSKTSPDKRASIEVPSGRDKSSSPATVITNVNSSKLAQKKAMEASPFLNTRSDVVYAGNESCRECHQEQEAGFRLTGMGKSSAEVNLENEPPDVVFDHPASNRRYQVQRRDGQMWHRELLPVNGEEVVLSEYPMKYVIGSGHHSLTYVFEDRGFMMESPITWYSSKKKWDMSPGYDRPHHSSFEREVGEGCLVCHVGQAKAIGGSMHRMHIAEASIGCEQCHGPGDLHVRKRREEKDKGKSGDGEIDYTIVNPSHLSRKLSEAVCEQCHLRSAAIVLPMGARFDDFRPGLPLELFRYDYRMNVADQAMTVVGHVEQMQLSRCYEAETFTCLTCHDPHASKRPSDPASYYNAVCNKCHTPDKCRVAPAVREKESPSNNCIQCHMPTTETDIPHIAFTHHRVGVHDKLAIANSLTNATVPDSDEVSIVPMRDQSHLSELEKQRALGLAYLESANRDDNEKRRGRFEVRAYSILSEARSRGLRDGTVDAWIARLRFQKDLDGVAQLAASALEDSSLVGQDRCNALFLLADAKYSEGRFAEAISYLDELKPLRRHSLQWLLRAQVEKTLRHDAAMIEALEEAVRINPHQPEIHRALAEIYSKRGDAAKAKWHEVRISATMRRSE